MEEGQAIDALSALAQSTRRRVFRMLMGAGARGIPAGEIAAAVGVPHNTMSTHLAALLRGGLVRSRKDGRTVLYSVDLEGTRALLAYLVSDCCGGHPQVCAPLLEIAEFARAKRPDAPPLSELDQGGPYNVLFLCTANSARSIMAEVILNSIGGGNFRAYSAGSEPSDAPMPEIITQLEALGHSVTQARSKSWDEFLAADAPRMDFVIALCDVLHDQKCPEFGRSAVSASWPLPDPRKFNGNATEQATFINELYHSLRRRLEMFVSLPVAELDRKALKARLSDISGGRVTAI